VPGLALPVQFATAHVDLDGDHISLRNASVMLGELSLGGSATFPRSCTADAPCNASFDLTSDDFDLARWNEVLNPHRQKMPWYLFGGGESRGTVFANLHATGHIAAQRLTLDPLTGAAFESDFSYANGALTLRDTRANLLGGTVTGDWKVDFTTGQPKIESTGAAERIQAEKLSPLLKASIGNGTLGLRYALQASGWDGASLTHSAVGETLFTWTGGALRVSPDTRTSLRVLRGTGKAVLDKKGWTISDSEWKTPSGTYQLSGTVSRDSALNLEFTQQDAVWKVGGTLAKPQPAAPATTTQARR
jgi:hypothetical protein